MQLKNDYIILTLLGVEIPVLLIRSITCLAYLSVFYMMLFTGMYILLKDVKWDNGKGITPLIPLYILMFVQPLIGILIKLI